MKKLLYCLSFAAMLLVPALDGAQDLQFGLKGGFAASWLTNTVVIGDEVVTPHNSFYAGGVAKYDIDGNFMLQAELLYAGKGHSDHSELRGKYIRSLSYIQVPLFAGYKFSSKDYTIMAGPEFGYLLGSRTTAAGKKFDSTGECRRFNIALALQSNYMVTDNFGVDVKFSWGANGTFAPGMYADLVNDNGRNVTVQVGVCWMFD